MKFILAIIIFYFIYRFWIKRQNSLNAHKHEDGALGEYIDYEEIEEDK